MVLGGFKAQANPVNVLGKPDLTRKVIMGNVTVDANNGKWTATVSNVPAGSYKLEVKADFSEIGNDKNRIPKAAISKKLTVSD